MSRSNDPGHYFQTSDALATSERKAAKSKNKDGDPIKLPSKILAAVSAGPGPETIYTAEAAGEIHRVDLAGDKTKRIFSQGSAPLTSIVVGGGGIVYAGSWDKNIYAVDPKRKEVKRALRGHGDFVKCLLITKIEGKEVLISGGADAVVIVWDLETGEVLHKIPKSVHEKALQDLAIDPISGTGDGSVTLFTATSGREIRRFALTLSTHTELHAGSPLLPHETSIYRLHFSTSSDSDSDLWTASADKTAKNSLRSSNFTTSDTTLQHPDFVRDVLPFEDLGVIVTACRDENVRVWDSASGKLLCTYSGHFEEVTALLPTGDGKGVVSVSIDGTVRRWGLTKGDMEAYQEKVRQEENGEAEEEQKEGEGMLTAEEEAELAELMEDDD